MFYFFLIFLIAMIFGLLWQINDCFQTISHLTLTVQEQKMAIEALSIVKEQQASTIGGISSEIKSLIDERTQIADFNFLRTLLDLAVWVMWLKKFY